MGLTKKLGSATNGAKNTTRVKLLRIAQKRQVGDVVTQNDPVAHGRTRRPLTQTELIKSARTREAGQSTLKHRAAHRREDSRTQGLRAGARQNKHKPQGRARARGHNTGKDCETKCTQNRTQYDFEKFLHFRYNKLDAEIGAQGESRTHTPVKAGDFESPASTIPPLGH